MNASQTRLNHFSAGLAMALAKQMVQEITASDLDQQITSAIEHLADCWESEETQKGIAAFFAKTLPPWQVES